MFSSGMSQPKQKSIFLQLISVFAIFTLFPLFVAGGLIIVSYGLSFRRLLEAHIEEYGLGREAYKEFFLLLESLKIQSFLLLLIVIILSLFGTILAARFLIRPIRQLINAIKKVKEGNLDLEIKVEAENELRELTDAFNGMLWQLSESQKLLQKEKQMLEARVGERTKELKELTVSLDKKVKERTRELEERVNELERFHKLTVGRELKMIELKKEIKKLKEELEKYKGRK